MGIRKLLVATVRRLRDRHVQMPIAKLVLIAALVVMTVRVEQFHG